MEFDKLLCNQVYSANVSMHDVLTATMSYLPEQKEEPMKVEYEDFERRKIKWDPNDLSKMSTYNSILNISLSDQLQFWDSPSSIPIFSFSISRPFADAAEKAFVFFINKPKDTNFYVSKAARQAYYNLDQKHKKFLKAGRPLNEDHPTKIAFKEARKELRQVRRSIKMKEISKTDLNINQNWCMYV